MSIRRISERSGKSQTEVAEALGICQSTVAMWESEKNKLHAERLLQLAWLYGCTVDELLIEEEEATS